MSPVWLWASPQFSYLRLRLGEYRDGNAGDSFRYNGKDEMHDGMKFSTKDSDNDIDAVGSSSTRSKFWIKWFLKHALNIWHYYLDRKQGQIHGHQLRMGGQGWKCAFSHFSTQAWRTNRRTNQPTDGWTKPLRVACPQLNMFRLEKKASILTKCNWKLFNNASNEDQSGCRSLFYLLGKNWNMFFDFSDLLRN